MNTIYNTDALYDRFFELVKNDDNLSKSDGQLIQFFKWLYDHDFLRNLTQFDYNFIIDKDCDHLCLPILRNHKIAIGVSVWDDYCRIGIDPSECFDRVSTCSIIIKLPLSKREEKRFYKTLDKLLDKKSTYSAEWFKEASSSWCGSFEKFGNI